VHWGAAEDTLVMIDRRSWLVAVALGAAVTGCGDGAPRAAAPPPPVVQTEPVVEQDVPIGAEWVGTLVGYVNAQIRPRVSGHLISQNYAEGFLVKSGDLLFQVDPRPFQIAVAHAEAQLKRAEATQRQTELDVARYTPLAQRGSVSQQELDNAVQTNQANLATVAAARAALAEARLNLGYTRVISPITGIAGFRGANLGDFVSPSDPKPLTTVSQVDPIYAEFPISEQRALALFRHWEADPKAPRDVELELILADGSVHSARGRAAALDRQVDLTAGTVLARGVFPNPGNVLRPGQYAKVRAVVETKKNALTVPQRAVQNVQGMQQIAVVRPDDTVDVRSVKVDARVGPLAVIAEGLKAGERVIVEGGDRVRPGQKVRVSPAAPAQAGAGK
jgi:membrane fusion protein (multidrug efflux system)